MLLWRISNHADLTGLGGELLSGRWHTAADGKRIVYLAEHPAVALVENLASLRGDPTLLPERFQLIKVSTPETLLARELTSRQLSAVDSTTIETSQSIGDAWLAARSSALLRVPSIPSPESWNYLLNPLHPDAAGLRIEWARAVRYDHRLFHLGRLKA
jgi:RES domain-containing protein